LVLNDCVVFGGCFETRILFHRCWEDNGDGEIELGVVGDGRNIIKTLPFVVEDGVELNSRVGVG
jgi:hypothetical protein